jgi:hypothetical protein
MRGSLSLARDLNTELRHPTSSCATLPLRCGTQNRNTTQSTRLASLNFNDFLREDNRTNSTIDSCSGSEGFDFSWFSDPTLSGVTCDTNFEHAPPFSEYSGDMVTPLGRSCITMDDQKETICTQNCQNLLFFTIENLDLHSISRTRVSACTQNLGMVLKASQSALDNLTRIVSCTCASSSNVALLCTSAMFSVLSRYEAILEISNDAQEPNGHREAGKSDCGNSSPSSWDSHSSVTTPTIEVFIPPISIGDFELGAEARALMVAYILHSELAKMTRVLDDFSKKFCRNGSWLGEDNDDQLHTSLEMFLRKKQGDILIEIKKKLGGVDGDIYFQI